MTGEWPVWLKGMIIVLGMLLYLILVAIAAHKRFATYRWLKVPPYLLSLTGVLLYFLREKEAIEALVLAGLAVVVTWVLVVVTRRQIP